MLKPPGDETPSTGLNAHFFCFHILIVLTRINKIIWGLFCNNCTFIVEYLILHSYDYWCLTVWARFNWFKSLSHYKVGHQEVLMTHVDGGWIVHASRVLFFSSQVQARKYYFLLQWLFFLVHSELYEDNEEFAAWILCLYKKKLIKKTATHVSCGAALHNRWSITPFNG